MTPFEIGEMIPIPNVQLAEEAARLGIPIEDFTKVYEETLKEEVWVNDEYQVNVRRHIGGEDFPPIIHLSVKRKDKAPIHDWRAMQQIKNELTDPLFEGVELFPAEDRLVDTANQYHIWVFADTKFRVPVGFPGRLVNYENGINGSVQRPE